MTDPGGPLSGVRVLDLGRYIAAPYCSMVLADLGAEVIRVERPGGEQDRTLGLCAEHGESFVFAGLGRNKLGVTLDLGAGERSRAVMHDLIGCCDVLLHNFGARAAGALGLAYEDVRAVRPDVVYAAISSFGPAGPDADRTGFDPIAQMSSGAAAVTGPEDGGPLRAGVPWVDYSTGLCAVVGILAALRHRDRAGEGQAVHCALLHTAVSYTTPIVAEASVGGRERPRLGNQPAWIGVSNLYPCSDGELYVVAVTPAAWGALAALVGEPQLGDDPSLATAEQRYERRAAIDPLVRRWTSSRTTGEAIAQLRAARVPCSVCRTPAEVACDPQVLANEMLRFVDLEHAGLDRVPASSTPVAFSTLPLPPSTRPPRPGEHNGDVYGDLLGYSADRLHELRAGGTI